MGNLVAPSDCKHQPASDKHGRKAGRQIEHVTAAWLLLYLTSKHNQWLLLYLTSKHNQFFFTHARTHSRAPSLAPSLARSLPPALSLSLPSLFPSPRSLARSLPPSQQFLTCLLKKKFGATSP